MVLQPRKFKYKSRQKLRRVDRTFRLKRELKFGQACLLLTRPLLINSKKMFRLKLFLKKAARKTDKTQRKVWVNTFPHIPLTKKTVGSRMGKGKGKLSIWFNKLSTGTILIELKNLRKGRATYFLRQAQNKLKSKSKIVFTGSHTRLIKLFLGRNSVSYRSIW